MESFFNRITYRNFKLYTAADVVQHSFIVQNSISPLNLELSNSFKRNKHPVSNSFKLFKDPESVIYYPSFSYSTHMINTEEKCRKILGPRNFLYRLHLDMPHAKESSLKNCIPLEYTNLTYSRIPVVQLFIAREFYIDKLFQFVNYACSYNHDKVKILKWLIKFNAIHPEEFLLMPEPILSCFVDSMNSELTDVKFATECLNKLDFEKWVYSGRESGRLANILYHVHRTGRKAEANLWCHRLIVQCLLDEKFQNQKEVMKIHCTPKFCKMFKEVLVFSLWFKVGRPVNFPSIVNLLHAEGPSRRVLLLLLSLWFYVKKGQNPSAASNALQLVWNSVPDVFLTIEEMKSVYAKYSFCVEEIYNIYDFYCQAVGKIGTSVNPRSLKHQCRTTIRRVLEENNIWLPEGIKQIGLPPILQTYLNLEV